MQRTLRVFLSMLAVALLYGCSSSLDTMTNAYNGTYEPTPAMQSGSYTINDVEKGEDMLANYYDLDYRTSLCIPAPSGAKSYEWKVTVGTNANGETEGSTTFLLSTDEELIIYPPNTQLKCWSSYTLTLTVTKSTGVSLTDSAILTIFKRGER